MCHQPLAHGWPGWWSKLELFRPHGGDLLYLDLDTVVRGDLQPLIDAPAVGRRCSRFLLARAAGQRADVYR
nr:hypothetical protein [Halomonas elongata]